MLHSIGVNAASWRGVVDPSAGLVATLEVHVLDVEGVDVAWEVSEEGEEDVDEEVGSTACNEGDADRRQEDGNDDE